MWLHVLDYYGDIALFTHSLWDAFMNDHYCFEAKFPRPKDQTKLVCTCTCVVIILMMCSPLIHSLCTHFPLGAIQNLHYIALYVLAGREWSHVITRTCLNWAVATINSTWSTSSSPRCLSTTCTRDSPLWPESAFM